MNEIDHSNWLAGLFGLGAVITVVSAPHLVAAFQTHRLRSVGSYRPNQWVKIGENAFEIERISLWSWKFRALSGASVRLSSKQIREHLRERTFSGPQALIQQTFEVQSAADSEKVTQVIQETMAAMPEVSMAVNLETAQSATLAGTHVVQAFGLTQIREREGVSRKIANRVMVQLKNINVLMHEQAGRILH